MSVVFAVGGGSMRFLGTQGYCYNIYRHRPSCKPCRWTVGRQYSCCISLSSRTRLFNGWVAVQIKPLILFSFSI